MSAAAAHPAVLLVGAGAEDAEALAEALEPVARLGRSSASADRLGTECRALGAEVALVAAAAGTDPATTFARVAALAEAGARVVVVGASKDPDLILGALRAGAREFVVGTDTVELRRVVAALARAVAGAARGDLIAVFNARGGVGATTLAVNLAGSLARRDERVCLLDVDLHLGDVLPFLDLPGGYSLTDVIANMSRLDRELLDASVTRHRSGLRVVAQSGRLEDAERMPAGGLRPVLDFLASHYDHLVVDGLRGFDELSLSVLDASQQIIMVLTQDVPAVRSARRCLQLFRQLGYPDAKVKLVVNRHQRGSDITSEVIAETVGLPVTHTLSNDFGSAIAAINRGVMLQELAPRSPLTRDLDELPAALTGQRGSGSRRSFFGLLRKGNDGSHRST
jgi:pilus assembly protein CpaE